mgnify:CR=1 FL=1
MVEPNFHNQFLCLSLALQRSPCVVIVSISFQYFFYFSKHAFCCCNFLAVCNLGLIVSSEVTRVPPDQDVGKSMTEIVASRGYTIETHNVTTADGYILTMFRIPSNKNTQRTSSELGPPVILQHGLLDSSYTWVANFEDESLGYILSDQGFDVWFGNNRGNRYGRNHVSKNPDDKTSGFWDFTWDDMASFDAPAMINYVTDKTGYPSIGWVGHSEGTIQMFAAGTSLETNTNDYFQKAIKSLNIFVALAPVAYVDNLKTRLLVALAQTQLPQRLYDRGYLEFLPYGPIEKVQCYTILQHILLFLLVHLFNLISCLLTELFLLLS